MWKPRERTRGLPEKVKNAFKAEVALELRLERLIHMYQQKGWGKVLEADGKACRKALIQLSAMKIFELNLRGWWWELSQSMQGPRIS